MMEATVIDIVEFVGFRKIPRLSRNIIVTEKIDGTNGQIYISNECEFLVGSRNRWITPDNDNHGFARWAYEHREQLTMELGAGQHFGEWWGQGINKRYAGAPKTFSLFNAGRWAQPWKEGLLTLCHVVPIVYEGMFDSGAIERVTRELAKNGSVVWPGSEAEGIIIYHTASAMMFKKTCEDDEKPKGKGGVE